LSNLIEVSEGIAINIDFIDKVVATTSGCTVHANGAEYPTVFPYRLFLSLIGERDKEEVKEVKLQPDAMNALNSLGHHFAG
jgi:hypothetical protein